MLLGTSSYGGFTYIPSPQQKHIIFVFSYIFISILGVVLTATVVSWCTIASSKLFVRSLDMQHQRILVAYPCALVYCVFALLVVF
ncbi:unnamed protein product [Schistosoma mattheei]|uniref:Uncharacterized protein n=1 Tax=Schistosoma mattheei TaxID=31246 RepID=A0A183NIX3_9TREM|nr:unnamed protein product [Schistosoma mattheei]